MVGELAQESLKPALGRRVGRSAGWSALNAGVLRASTFAVSLLVARLVAPYQFGVFAVAFTIMTVALALPQLGVASAIVREHDRSTDIAPTVLTISLVGGALVAFFMALLAPVLARGFGAPEATNAVRVLAIVPLLSGFSALPAALMSRDFLQRKQFVADAAFFVVSTITMVALVLGGHAVMGLVWSQIAGHVVSISLLIWMAPERYLPGWRRHEAARLLAFGVPLAGSNLINLAIANVDFVVVGHWLGPEKLGYYNLAFNISGWPVTIFGAVLISVTLPVLSRARHDPRELVRHAGAALSAVAAPSFPVCALLSALAGPLINVVYGTRWHAAWSALLVLAIFGAARTVLSLFSDVTIALGLTRRLLYIQVTWLAALVPLMILCVNRWGIFGAGVAHAGIVVLVVFPLYLVTLHRHTPIPLGTVRLALARPFIASLCSGAVAYTTASLVEASVAKLLLGLAAGLVVYGLLAGRWLTQLGRTLHDMYWRRTTEPRPVLRPPEQLATPCD